MDFGIKDKRVLVTGASRGIGAAIARAFAGEGCKVSILARQEANLKQVFEEMGGAKKGHSFLAMDLMEDQAPTKALNKFLKGNDPFDIVVHNIGGACGCKDFLAPVKDWLQVWQFNAGIAIEMNALLVPLMQKQRWGRIIHISSVSAKLGEPRFRPYGGALPYAAAKAYLNAYVQGLGRELAESNVVVTALMPGVILCEGKYWDKLRNTNPELVNDFLKHHCPIGRFGKPEEIASFAVFLGSQQASFAAGSIIPVDGGRM